MVLAFTFLGAPYLSHLPAAGLNVVELVPWWGSALVVLLACAFNRSKVVLATLVLLGGYYALTQWLLGGDQGPLWQIVVFGLVPVNLAIVSCYQERGLLTAAGYVRLGLLALQAAAIAWLGQTSTPAISELVQSSSVLTTDSLPVSLGPLSQLTALLLITSTLVTLISSWRINTPVGYALLGAFVAYALMVLAPSEPLRMASYMLAALLLLSTGLLRDSYNMAYLDELTGLPQRRALNEQLMALGNHYTLAMLDVDHFKKFNDTHGHDIGDEVLKLVAAQIRKVRGGGRAYRYGGEEFTVVFKGRDKDDAAHFLEQVRKAIADYEMVVRDDPRHDEKPKKPKKNRSRGSYRKATKKVSVTISIGVAEHENRKDTPEQVLKKADEALYKAKKAGRNQIAIA